jgi:hypothetical protein
MKTAPTTALTPFEAQRRHLLQLAAVGALNLSAPIGALAVPQTSSPVSLSDLSGADALTGPLLSFRSLAEDPDGEIQTHIYSEIARKPGLMDRLKAKVGADRPISLELKNLKIELKYIPETRMPLARAYQDYCREAVVQTCRMAQMPSIYKGVFVPQAANPTIATGEGVSAFVVHRLVKAYEAICEFSGSSGSVKFKVAGAIYSNHLGAVEMEVEGLPDGSYRIARRNYTIWQDHNDNIYTLLQIPVEETLHFLMGRHTDRNLLDLLHRDDVHQTAQVKELASHWMAVEEALVGGLVEQVLPALIRSQALSLEDTDIQRSAAAKAGLPQYRYREVGVQLVETMGFEGAMQMYREDPLAFERQLTQA